MDNDAKRQILEDEKKKLQELVNIAFNKGVLKAIKKVEKMNDPFLVDAFHDILVDRLYNELVKRKKL